MSGGGDQAGGSREAAPTHADAPVCRLQQLPIDLVVRMWPAQRVVMAGRTSRWLRQQVMPRCVAWLHGSSSATEEDFSPESVAHSLSLVRGADVKWAGPRGRVLLRGIQRARTEGFTGVISALSLEGSWMEGAGLKVVEESDANPEWWTEDFEQVLDVAQLLTKTLSQHSSSLVHLSLSLSAGALGNNVLIAQGAPTENPFDSVWHGLRRTEHEPRQDTDFFRPLGECTQLRHLQLSAAWLGQATESRDEPLLPARVLQTLTHLELSCVGMREPGDDDDAFQRVIEELPDSCALETLYLRDSGVGYHGIEHVLQLGRKCPKLRRLDVRGGLICTHAGEILQSLACCAELTDLNLADNCMDERASATLAARLGGLHSLKRLNLAANDFGSDPHETAEDEAASMQGWLADPQRPHPGMQALAEALSSHPTLEVVDLRDNGFERGVKETVRRQLLPRLPALQI